MVKIALKHVHRVKKKLADGAIQTYFYAWRGGPRINDPETGKPIDPDHPMFLTVLGEHRKTGGHQKAERIVRTLILEFKKSTDYPKNNSTKRDYDRYLKAIDEEFGDLPIAALKDPEVRGDFMVWRDGMADTPRKADYAWTVLSRLFSCSKNRGRIPVNPCERGGRIYTADRRDNIWTEEDLGKLFAVASAEVISVVMMALWTGQRQKDVLRMPWSAIVGTSIRVPQSKGSRRVMIPMGSPLVDHLKTVKRVCPTILTSSHNTPWTSDGFRSSFATAKERAGITDLTFHDLRGTAVTRMAIAGCTVLEIAAVTGHSPKDVEEILQRHYLSGQVTLAEQAIAKLQAHVSENG